MLYVHRLQAAKNVDSEADLFAPESDFDSVPARSQEKGQALLHKLQ